MNSQLVIFCCFTQFVMFSHFTNGFPSSPFENHTDTVGSVHSHHHSGNQEIVLVRELIQFSGMHEGGGNNATDTFITFSETSNNNDDADDDDENDSSLSDEHPKQDMMATTTTTTTMMALTLPPPSDDLIFLAKKPRNHVLVQSHDSSGEEDSLAAHSNSNSAEEEDEEAEQSKEITTAGSQPPIKPIDMSDFLALIPAAEVQSIVANYYHNDAEVQRAYVFLSSRYFADMRQHLIQMPEIKACLRYLNNSGLDVMAFLQTVSNQTSIEESKQRLTSIPITIETTRKPTMMMMANDIENRFNSPIESSANTDNPMETTTTMGKMTTTAKEHLNGLHGLVDSILEVLPQDQILSTFFDKLETDEQFSKLIDNIGTPTFAKILSNMQNSVPLRNFIFTLHNNGIYIARIVDSLKSYFFLG